MRVFITGVDGLTGGNLAWYFKDRVARVLGISRTHPVAIPDVETPALNVQNYNRVRQCLTQFKPEVIIHTISAVHYGHDPADQERSWRSNVLSTRVILDAARDLHARVVLISIEAEDSPFNEEVPIVGDPENWYVSDRTEAERMVMDHPESLVLRTRLFGWNVGDVECFPEWLLRNLFNKETVFCFTERVFSAIYVLDFAELLGRCLRQGVTGFFRVIGNDDLSNYSFGQELARIFGLDPAFIQPRIVRLPLPANAACLPTDGQPTLLNEIGGGQVPTVREGLAAFFRDWRDGFPNRLKECAKVAAPVCILPQRDVIPYGCQLIDADDMEAVTKVLHSWSLTQGPTIDHFEKDVAQTVHARYAVAVNSGTAALHIACLACGVGPGDEVITSPITFAASANCAVYCGAVPLFVDIDPQTYNMDPDALEQKITARTRAVIPVHFAGQSCDMKRIHDIVRKKEIEFGRKITLIEDACHALGSCYLGTPVGDGRFSDMTIFSFHPVKHITTGEGGMVVTNDMALEKKLKILRSHGISKNFDATNHGPWYYEQVALGFNYRMTDLQCALGISQLKKLNWFRDRRRKIVQRYNEAFSGLSWGIPPYEAPQSEANFHLYVLRCDFVHLEMSRIELMGALKDRGILTQVHYIPVFSHPYYRERFPVDETAFPHTWNYYETCLSLPLFPGMSDAEVETVIREVCALAKTKKPNR